MISSLPPQVSFVAPIHNTIIIDSRQPTLFSGPACHSGRTYAPHCACQHRSTGNTGHSHSTGHTSTGYQSAADHTNYTQQCGGADLRAKHVLIYYSNATCMTLEYMLQVQGYRIAGTFRGRKLSQFSLAKPIGATHSKLRG
jgi:hypothetical protein